MTTEKKPKESEFELDQDQKLLLKATGWDRLEKAIAQAKQREQTLNNVRYTVEGNPLDVIVAINITMEQEFGYTEALKEFWGMRPPDKLSIKTSINTEVQCYTGKLAPPAWEGGYIQMDVDPGNPMALRVTGQLKQKFEPSMNKVIAAARSRIRNHSILKSQATEHDMMYLDLMRGGYPFDPVNHAPKYIDVSNPPTLILPTHIERLIHMVLWDIIRNPDDFRYNGVSIKTGVMKSGPPGTGKTLSALHTAKRAVEAGWTVIKLITPQHFVECYNMAQFYAPCVLIVEDVEKIFGGPATPFMDQILDRLDGIATKGSEVITICTTNHPELINEKVRRSGRIGRHIVYDTLDGEACGRFIKTYSEDFLDPLVDLNQAGEAFNGLVAADLTEGINLAKKMAIGEFGREIRRKLTTEMLVDAAEIIKRDKGLYAGKGMTQEAFNLRIVQAAWWIQMGKEFDPVEFATTAQEFAGSSRKARAREVETLTDQEG